MAPLVEDTWSWRNARGMMDAPGFLLGLARTHGPFFQVKLGPATMTVVAEPTLLQQVLQKRHQAWGRGTSVDGIRPLLGNGLPLSDPPAWLSQRRTMQPSFHQGRWPSWADAVSTVAQRFVGALQPGAKLPVRTLMMQIARDVIVRTMFTTSMDAVTTQLDHAFSVVEHYVGRVMLPGPPLWVPTPGNLRFKSAIRFIHQSVQHVIDERKAMAEPPLDLLTLLLQAKDPETGQGMNDAQLRDEVTNIFFAGHETTANLMTWTTFLLSTHPAARERAASEVRDVLGDRVPTTEDLPKLPWLGAVLREALRLYPPAWLFARQAFEPDSLDGVDVKKGDVVLLLPYLTHRLEQYWPEPDRFDPARFDGQPAIDAQSWKYRYLPFGAGPHVCIGNHFAMLEATVVLAMLLRRGHFEVTDPGAVRPKMGATLYAGDGLPSTWVAN